MSDVIEIIGQDTLAILEPTIDIIGEGFQGPAGIQGERGEVGPPGTSTFEAIAGVALSGHRIVILDESGQLAYASSADFSHIDRIVGMTTGSIDAGATAAVKGSGELVEPSWAWDVLKPVYLAQDGLLTQEAPTAPDSKFSMVVGFPTSSTSLFIRFREPIILS